MLPEVEKLLRVQHHDQKVRSLEKDLAGIPLEEEDIRERLEEDRAAMEAAKLAMQRTEVEIKSLEIEADTRRDSIAKLKVQQYETRKNEEFRAMGRDIERHQEEIAKIEDREIELMEVAETQRAEYEAARKRLNENEIEVAKDLEDLKSLAGKLKADREEELAASAAEGKGLETHLLELYQRIFKAKNGLAVVGLVDGVCQGCHMKVVKSTLVAVKGGKELATCENCGRILYWWTDEKGGGER